MMSSGWKSFEQMWTKMVGEEGVPRDVLVASSLFIGLGMALVYTLCSRRRTEAAAPSGPGILFVLKSFMEFYKNKHRLLEYNTDMLLSAEGHTVITGLYTMTVDPSNVEHMLKTNFDNYPKGEFINGLLREMLGDGIFNADDEHWKIQRKVASPEFSTRALRDFILESVVKETDRVFLILSRVEESGEMVDLQDIFTRFAIDNICQVTLGVDPGCLEANLPEVEFANAFDRATSMSLQKIQTFPAVLWTLQKLLNVGNAKELRDAVKLIDEFAMGVIRNRRQEKAGGKADLLSKFMTLVDDDREEEIRGPISVYERKWMEDRQKGGDDFSNLFLRDMIISFVMAGRDSSTAALSWFFWILIRHPQVEKAILDEIRSVAKSEKAPTSEKCSAVPNISYDELKNMNYLHAALTESIRLYPPVPVNFKTAKKADVWPDGTVVSPKSVVGYHPYAMGRMEFLWGKDCREFKPERWLKDGVFEPRSPFVFTAFHAGPRICLGKDMIMLQMKFICTQIIGNFELTLPEGYDAQLSSTSLTLRLKDGLPVRLKRRPKSPIGT